MSPELQRLLNTFWSSDASFPETNPAAESFVGTVPSSRPTVTSNHELLSLWQVLDSVDPDEAKRWHWRDGRKVRRGIERWWERGGVKVEALVNEHKSAADGRQARWGCNVRVAAYVQISNTFVLGLREHGHSETQARWTSR